jgi:gluconokinase
MAAGEPLTDDDRYPWLEAVGQWLARHADGGVMSCSALKRSYRDQLRSHCARIEFVHLTGSPDLIARRQADRPGHFMPSSLEQSQFAALQPLQPDEGGITVDVAHSVDAIVDEVVRRLSA